MMLRGGGGGGGGGISVIVTLIFSWIVWMCPGFSLKLDRQGSPQKKSSEWCSKYHIKGFSVVGNLGPSEWFLAPSEWFSTNLSSFRENPDRVVENHSEEAKNHSEGTKFPLIWLNKPRLSFDVVF